MPRTLEEVRNNPTAADMRLMRRFESVFLLLAGAMIAWDIADQEYWGAFWLTTCFLSLIFIPRKHESEAVKAERAADRP